LSCVRLPPNIRVMTYPDILLARRYPTLGPGGPSKLDVNRLACSIELYVGRDVLTLKDKLMPVQWTGFNNTLRQYQGEVLDKAELQRRFMAKVARSQRRKGPIREVNWSEMRALLEKLFSAFQ
jgi:hypothetical protein